jgi:hypothetical protein
MKCHFRTPSGAGEEIAPEFRFSRPCLLDEIDEGISQYFTMLMPLS